MVLVVQFCVSANVCCICTAVLKCLLYVLQLTRLFCSVLNCSPLVSFTSLLPEGGREGVIYVQGVEREARQGSGDNARAVREGGRGSGAQYFRAQENPLGRDGCRERPGPGLRKG